MFTGNGTGWTVSTEMFGQKKGNFFRAPVTKDATDSTVEPPTMLSVVFLQLGLGFAVRTVLNLSSSESNLDLRL